MNRLVAVATIPIVVLLISGTTFAQGKGPKSKRSAGATTASLALDLPTLDTWEMPNGLKVAYMGVHKAPIVTVQLWYHVGSKEEARNRRGSAHMFEHMMFKGTKNLRPEEHARHLNRLGGYINAFTTQDVTAYHDTLPKEYLDFAVKLEAERMTNLLFRQEMIDKEREVVKEEIRQQENSPISKGFLRFLEIAYKKHPYSWTAGGTIADLDATTVEDLQKFYETYYIPNNAMLVVVGDVSKSDVEASAKKWFGDVERGAVPPRPADSAVEPKQTRERRETAAPGQVGLFIGGYHIPRATHADVYALDVLALILSGGESSRLHKRLVREDKVAIQAGGEARINEHPGLFLVYAAYLDPAHGPKAEASMYSEIEKLRKKAPTTRELQKAKNQLLSGFVRGLEGVTGLASQVGNSWIQTGEPGDFLTSLKRYNAVTPQDVRRVAKTYLAPQGRTVVVIPPKAPGVKGGK